jgi:hypothetical protein
LWNNSATWSGGRVPGPNDTVVINNPVTITLNISPAVAKLVVNAGGGLNDSTFTISVTGGFVLNGVVTGFGTVSLTTARDTIYGIGTMAATSTLEIAATKAVHRTANLSVPTMTILASDTLRNFGTMTVSSVGGPGTWVNASNSTLNITGAGITAGTLNASACPNLVSFTGTGVQTVAPTTYCDLLLANAGQKTLAANALVQTSLSIASGSNLTINSGVTMQVLGPVSVAGTVTNNGKLKISD